MMMEYLAAHPLAARPVVQFPPAGDRAAWQRVAPGEREDLLALAADWRGKPYPLLTAGMYASYVRTGSRKDCETPYFGRRVKLCAAALHVCLTGEDTDLPAVEDGLMLICEETAWAISAHLSLTAEHPFPDARQTVIDLFAAQTGMILSFVCQLLEDRLHPDVRERVRSEVERRILQPFMHNDNEWWMGFVRKDLCNWTPWIVSNVMMAANVWQDDCAALFTRACGMLDRWLICVPEDGGCDEGAGYWNMAGGAFLDCLMLLEQTCGASLWDVPKLRKMMAYPELMHLGGGWFANFADCDARPYISGERLQYAGEKTGNPALIRMGCEMRGLPTRELSDTPHLSRVLMRLFHPVEDMRAVEAPGKDVWLPDLQMRLLDSHELCGSSRGDPRLIHTTVAMKGGHNGESHNHNDVGSFIMAVDGKMQVVDAGNMVYTAKTFSDRRYELWNCRSIYHNVPVIAGYEQQPGAQYAARDVQCTESGMTLDMAAAYPAEAGVRRCHRELILGGATLSVKDEITLDTSRPVTWVFMLRDEPIIEAEYECCHGRETDFFVEWRETEPLTAAVERIDITDPRMQGSYPGTLWRLTLTAEPAAYHKVHITMQA
ncbi:MAG: heparinase II/III family protein [Clostridia bacterium]|nr:heparinase II/III family protein [Clostridia bacterium]